MKDTRKSTLFRRPWWLAVLILCVVFVILSGDTTSRIEAFNVDNAGKLYVGFEDRVEIYEKGTKIQSFPTPNTYGKPYALDVSETPDIRVVTFGVAYTVDQNGNVTERTEHSISAENVAHAATGAKYVRGTVYQKKGLIWPRIVIRGGETVYRLPFAGVLVRILDTFGIFVFALIILAIVKAKSENQS